MRLPDSLRALQISYWLALLLIACVSVLAFISTQRVTRAADRLHRTQTVVFSVQETLSQLKDVESGARGFVLTGNRQYLAPYLTSYARVGANLELLAELASDDATLHSRLGRLRQLAAQRLALARTVVAQGRDGEVRRATLDAGRHVMDAIRGEAGALLRHEQERYARERHALLRRARIANIALGSGVLFSLLVLIGAFFVTRRAIDKRERAEAALQSANKGLEANVKTQAVHLAYTKGMLEAIIEGIPDFLILKDADNNFRFVFSNRVAECFLGKSRDELLGLTDADIFVPEEARRFMATDQEVIASGKPIVLEETVTTPQGVRLMETRKIPIRAWQTGRARLLLVIARDITEQRDLEHQLRQVQKMDAVGQLTGGVAHDFNNLLAIILGNADLLREELPEGSEAAELADEVIGAAQRGADLVRRLLAFARKQQLAPEVVNLNERLPAVVALLERTLGEQIRIQTALAPNLWPALVDPAQVEDALINLAINARDAMPSGGTLTIETANEQLDADYAAKHDDVRPGDYVMLVVSDTGTGMPPAVLARVFEPFFTTKEPGRGTGLGLSQVYGMIKQSGGHINIYSEPGHGTTIRLYLPRAFSADGVQEIMVEEEAPTGQECILVVEDNPDVRRIVVRQLSDLGYATLEAGDGREALAMIDSGISFDLLFSDVVMPEGMTGYDLARAVRARNPSAKVLLTSGYTNLAAQAAEAEELSLPLISKPYRKPELARAVREALNGEGS